MEAYAPKSLKRIKATCTVATLKRGADSYVISGTSDTAMPRIAVSSDRDAPLLFLMTVPDITAARPTADIPNFALESKAALTIASCVQA